MCCAPSRGPESGGGSWKRGRLPPCRTSRGRRGLSERYVGRMTRLAYLAPEVLEALVVKRRAPAISINDMVEVAKLPWDGQMGHVFN